MREDPREDVTRGGLPHPEGGGRSSAGCCSWRCARASADNAEIGRRLVISEATVKTHLLRLFAKLGVNDRTRAVVVAMERGLLPHP
ncbi:regulatory LuxR family protein [Streptomyces sp. BK340]|nr:regulatory LuxR family protein [Streptomyces sp. BK340]